MAPIATSEPVVAILRQALLQVLATLNMQGQLTRQDVVPLDESGASIVRRLQSWLYATVVSSRPLA